MPNHATPHCVREVLAAEMRFRALKPEVIIWPDRCNALDYKHAEHLVASLAKAGYEIREVT